MVVVVCALSVSLLVSASQSSMSILVTSFSCSSSSRKVRPPDEKVVLLYDPCRVDETARPPYESRPRRLDLVRCARRRTSSSLGSTNVVVARRRSLNVVVARDVVVVVALGRRGHDSELSLRNLYDEGGYLQGSAAGLTWGEDDAVWMTTRRRPR